MRALHAFSLALALLLSLSLSLTLTRTRIHSLRLSHSVALSPPSLCLLIYTNYRVELRYETFGCQKKLCELSNTRKNDTSKLRMSSKARLCSLYLRIACSDDSVCSVWDRWCCRCVFVLVWNEVCVRVLQSCLCVFVYCR